MRWRQKINEDGTSEFVPLDSAARLRSTGASIHGDITPFVSPVDGTVVSDRAQLREHNKRNNVVNTSEFDTNHWEKKAKERADFFEGRHTKVETFERKRELYETWIQAEREHGR